jgi:hypothetical protein
MTSNKMQCRFRKTNQITKNKMSKRKTILHWEIDPPLIPSETLRAGIILLCGADNIREEETLKWH